MSFLVDTNIFSEPVKPKPDPKIVAWLREHEDGLYVSAITIARTSPRHRAATQWTAAHSTPRLARGFRRVHEGAGLELQLQHGSRLGPAQGKVGSCGCCRTLFGQSDRGHGATARSLRKRSGKQVLLPNKRSPLRFERSRSHLAEDTNVFQLVSSLRMHDHQIIVAEDRRGIPVC